VDCILHEGTRKGLGYGAVGHEYAHRVAYRKAYGEIPEGHLVHHTCGIKLCVNPDHLVALPNARAHSERHRKTHCKHGHEFTPENTWVDKHGTRHCRTCRRDAMRRFQGWPRGPIGRPKQTHCKNGHELTPENRLPSGQCAICRKVWLVAWKASPAGEAARERRNAKKRAARAAR
jgi:HNH endonuclease